MSMTPIRSALLIMMIALLSGCSEGKSPDPKASADPASRPVLAERAIFAPRGQLRNFVGTLRPRIESDLGFRVSGKIAERRVALGERVKAGTRLAVLDSIDLNLQREQAEAELSAATISLEQNRLQDNRNADLRKKGWVTDATVERQQAVTADARGRLERAKRSFDLAVNQLAYSDLIADHDGIITAVMAEPGQVVAAGTPILRMAQDGEMEVAIAIPEAMTARVSAGAATVALWSNPDKIYKARLRELSAAADPATRTFAARFSVSDADTSMSFGMTATLTIVEAGDVPLAALPLTAILDEGKGPNVFVIDPATGTISRKPVSLRGHNGSEVLISEGISEGDLVVTHGVHKLLAGERVRIVANRG